jgi:hypothetical protein
MVHNVTAAFISERPLHRAPEGGVHRSGLEPPHTQIDEGYIRIFTKKELVNRTEKTTFREFLTKKPVNSLI